MQTHFPCGSPTCPAVLSRYSAAGATAALLSFSGLSAAALAKEEADVRLFSREKKLFPFPPAPIPFQEKAGYFEEETGETPRDAAVVSLRLVPSRFIPFSLIYLPAHVGNRASKKHGSFRGGAGATDVRSGRYIGKSAFRKYDKAAILE